MNWYKSAGDQWVDKDFVGEPRVQAWTEGALHDYGDPGKAIPEMEKVLHMFEREVRDKFEGLARWKRVMGRYKRKLENAQKETENMSPEEMNKPGEDRRTPLERIPGFRNDVISALDHQGAIEGRIRDQQQEVEDMKNVIKALQSRKGQA
jgi:hypothetical protein